MQENFKKIMTPLKEALGEHKFKAETNFTEHEGVLFGKGLVNNKKCTVVIHIKEEDFTPSTKGSGHVKQKEAQDVAIIPSLNLQKNVSQKHGLPDTKSGSAREKFVKEVEKQVLAKFPSSLKKA